MDNSRTKRVSDVMSTGVLRVDGKALVREAVELMRTSDVSSLIVERLDETDEFGLITMADIAREIVAKNRSLDRVNVLEIMSKPVLSVPQNMTLLNATRLLAKFDISRAAVIDDERNPVGMVTRGDLVFGCLDSE